MLSLLMLVYLLLFAKHTFLLAGLSAAIIIRCVTHLYVRYFIQQFQNTYACCTIKLYQPKCHAAQLDKCDATEA